MKYIKIFFILILVWPKFWYIRKAEQAEKIWKEEGERSPLYCETTKKLIKKQKRAKRWALIMSLFPLGPVSLFVTWLSFRFEKNKTIEYYVSQQIPEVEELRELRRKHRETLIKYLEEKFKVEDNINWENIILPGSEEELQIREFLFGENGILTRGPKPKKENINEQEAEELNI